MARRNRATGYLLATASALAALVGAAVLTPPTDAVAGTAEPVAEHQLGQRQNGTTKREEPAKPGNPDTPAASPRDSTRTGAPDRRSEPEVAPAPSGQRPGTIRLPDGGSASLVRHAVGPDAVLPVPENLGEATWWGAGLGAPSGASVFAGHVNWQGQEGPFSELWQARVGERVVVAGDGGTKFRYEISRILTLHKNEVPARARELFGQSGRHRAVLVTCGGRWQGGATGYEENRVVIAEPV